MASGTQGCEIGVVVRGPAARRFLPASHLRPGRSSAPQGLSTPDRTQGAWASRLWGDQEESREGRGRGVNTGHRVCPLQPHAKRGAGHLPRPHGRGQGGARLKRGGLARGCTHGRTPLMASGQGLPPQSRCPLCTEQPWWGPPGSWGCGADSGRPTPTPGAVRGGGRVGQGVVGGHRCQGACWGQSAFIGECGPGRGLEPPDGRSGGPQGTEAPLSTSQLPSPTRGLARSSSFVGPGGLLAVDLCGEWLLIVDSDHVDEGHHGRQQQARGAGV